MRIALAVVLVALALVPAGAAGGADARVYSGLGSWVDVFAARARAHPQATAAALERHGVATLYLETSNYSHPDPVVHAVVVSRLLEAVHARGIRVVAWYLPSFVSPRRDLAASLAAIRFRSAHGQRFDGFAVDVEASLVRDVALRNAHLLALVRELRRRAPAGYPLGAIIPSPVGMRRHPRYWPRFPYRQLAASVDAFLPMAYFSNYPDARTRSGAFAYTRTVVAVIRRKTGDPSLPIHLIGGIANRIGPGALAGFATAARACGVSGVSLYAFLETSEAEWAQLARTELGAPPSGCG